jgi:hypothetical protein
MNPVFHQFIHGLIVRECMAKLVHDESTFRLTNSTQARGCAVPPILMSASSYLGVLNIVVVGTVE